MKLDYDFVNKSLDEQIMLFLNNCTTNIDFSQRVLTMIIIELMSKSDNEILELIRSEDPDIQKVGIQLLFGPYLYVFNTALSLRHYDYECLHCPHFIAYYRHAADLYKLNND